MAENNEVDDLQFDPDDGLYIDSSALAKLCVPEPESELLNVFFLAAATL